MTHPIQTHFTVHTATFQDDSNIPGTEYGDEVPVKIISHSNDGKPNSVTIKIGKYMFTTDTINMIASTIDRHNLAVRRFNEV